MLAECTAPVTQRELELKCSVAEGGLDEALTTLQESGIAVSAGGGTWLHRDVLRETGGCLLAAVEEFHQANPQRAGINRDELASRIKVNARLLDLAAAPLLESKQLERNASFFARAGWSPRLSECDLRLCDQIAAKLQMSRFAPPGPAELSAALDEAPPRITAMLLLLTERGLIIQLDDRVWMHRSAVEAGRQMALALFRKAPGFSADDFCKALGVGARHAMPLLDYLQRHRVTIRTGNKWIPGVEANRFIGAALR